MQVRRTVREILEERINYYLTVDNVEPTGGNFVISAFTIFAQRIMGHGEQGRVRAKAYKLHLQGIFDDGLQRMVWGDIQDSKEKSWLSTSKTLRLRLLQGLAESLGMDMRKHEQETQERLVAQAHTQSFGYMAIEELERASLFQEVKALMSPRSDTRLVKS